MFFFHGDDRTSTVMTVYDLHMTHIPNTLLRPFIYTKERRMEMKVMKPALTWATIG